MADDKVAIPTWGFRVNTRCGIDSQGCVFCGGRLFASRPIISDELAATWGLSERERAWFDEREGNYCAGCGMTFRVRMLLWTVRQVAPSLRDLRILHMNQINQLNGALPGAESVVETVYRNDVPLGALVGRFTNQDLQCLTFDDGEFDLAIHSEDIEHVNDYRKALAEIARVLKSGGWQVYTVPLLHGRQTRRRAAIENGLVRHLLPPSWHGCAGEYLVVWEFGDDLFGERASQIQRLEYDDFARNPTVFAIAEQKRG